MIVVERQHNNSTGISWREQVNVQGDNDEVRFVLDQHPWLNFYSASSLKQQFAGRHIAPLGRIILIPSHPVFAISPYCCVLSGEATNTNFIVFGLIQSGLEPMIFRTRGDHANHYTTDAICFRTHEIQLYYKHDNHFVKT